MNKKDLEVSSSEMEMLVKIYRNLSEPRRSILVMGGNLLLASQNAECNTKNGPRKAGQYIAAHWKPNRKRGEKNVDIKEKVDGYGEKNIRP